MYANKTDHVVSISQSAYMFCQLSELSGCLKLGGRNRTRLRNEKYEYSKTSCESDGSIVRSVYVFLNQNLPLQFQFMQFNKAHWYHQRVQVMYWVPRQQRPLATAGKR